MTIKESRPILDKEAEDILKKALGVNDLSEVLDWNWPPPHVIKKLDAERDRILALKL
jgi:hypothetical protein